MRLPVVDAFSHSISWFHQIVQKPKMSDMSQSALLFCSHAAISVKQEL